VTEHMGWPRPEFNAFASQQTLPLILALEAYTPLGHIITLGLDHYVTGYSGGLDTIETLRKEVDRIGGFMILAHPFRHSLRTGATTPRTSCSKTEGQWPRRRKRRYSPQSSNLWTR